MLFRRNVMQTDRRRFQARILSLLIKTCLPHAPPAGHWSSLALAFAAGANGFSGDAGHDRRNKRRHDQTVEVIFEPALSAFAPGLSADPIRIPRVSK
jgi:hypothetical protein